MLSPATGPSRRVRLGGLVLGCLGCALLAAPERLPEFRS